MADLDKIDFDALETVYKAFETVLQDDKEVKCTRDGPSSLKCIASLFREPNSTSDLVCVLKSFSSALLIEIQSTLAIPPNTDMKLKVFHFIK